MTQIKNLTPHDITVMEEGKPSIVFPARQGETIRLEETQTKIFEVTHGRIPVFKKDFGKANLPPQFPDTFYIVSLVVAQSFPDRKDFLIVNDTVRDEKGQIVGCRSFATVANRRYRREPSKRVIDKRE